MCRHRAQPALQGVATHPRAPMHRLLRIPTCRPTAHGPAQTWHTMAQLRLAWRLAPWRMQQVAAVAAADAAAVVAAAAAPSTTPVCRGMASAFMATKSLPPESLANGTVSLARTAEEQCGKRSCPWHAPL